MPNRQVQRPRERGFSLIEMLIAVFMSSILIMAVFHVNATFQTALTRQDEISRMQQSMKIVRTLLDRRLRAAGSGITVGNVVSGCGGNHQVGPFVLHNKNTFGVADTVEGGADDDPDWFEVMSADISLNGRITQRGPIMGNSHEVDDHTKFKDGDIVGIKTQHGMCLLMVTKQQPSPGKILFGTQGSGPSAMANCYNNPQENKACEDNVLQEHFLNPGEEVINFGSGTFALRIDTSVPDQPVLMMATGTAGGVATQYAWQPLASNVEDMQIAAHVDTSVPPDDYGDLWVSSRDLTTAELNKVRAVRISLVFRSTTPVTGFALGRRPALEDRAVAPSSDGYVRRVLSMVVKLRNRPEEP